jgi:hypothetical protein
MCSLSMESFLSVECIMHVRICVHARGRYSARLRAYAFHMYTLISSRERGQGNVFASRAAH